MCGLCGIARFEAGPAPDRDVIARMTRTLVHRGPDSEGYFFDAAVGLGFRRLSIIDLATGDQPIANEAGDLQLVCNGEIFNWRGLRRGLEARGHRFRGGSVVEVILHLYEEHGDAVVDHLSGQFAFALYDRTRGRVLLARDHFGIAPLFYACVGGALVFASEIKALLAYPGVSRAVDLTGLDQILSLPGLVSPRTMFRDVRSLPPGHLLVFDREGVRTRRYWDVDYPRQDARPCPLDEREAIEELAARLARAVEARLMADVPVGAYLSGGLDSSLIVRLIHAASPERRETFSIVVRDAAMNEERFQCLVADAVGFPHHAIAFDLADIEERLARAIWHCECPLKESYNTASLKLSEMVRERGTRVVLSGEGADELFAGYPSYRFDVFRRSRPVRPPSDAERRLRRQLWGDECLFYEHDYAARAAENRAMYAPALRARASEFEFAQFGVVDHDRLAGRHPLHQRSYLDLKLRLADHLVGDHGDRMLLASSIEGRYPFLDTAVVEWAAAMPPELKLNGMTEKYAVKQLARPLLPAEIIDREKFGFVTPGTPELLQAGSALARDALARDTIEAIGIFDPDAVDALRAQYATPGFSLNLPYEEDRLMVVLTTTLFMQRFQLAVTS